MSLANRNGNIFSDANASPPYLQVSYIIFEALDITEARVELQTLRRGYSENEEGRVLTSSNAHAANAIERKIRA